jgi:hypothetical protein
MKRLIWIAVLLALPCAAQSPQAAHPSAPPSAQALCKPGLQLVDGKLVMVDCKGKTEAIGEEAAPCADTEIYSSPLRQKVIDAQLKYLIYSWHHTRNVFVWQYWSGIVIFVVSVLLVAAGIVFAAWQLQYSMRLGSKRMEVMDAHAAALNAAAAAGDGTAASAAACEPSDTTLKISATGLEVHSATLGVIILAFSMCFFYMYLKYVYPIQLVQTQPVTQTQR